MTGRLRNRIAPGLTGPPAVKRAVTPLKIRKKPDCAENSPLIFNLCGESCRFVLKRVDEVVIASASNQRQVFALADNVKDRLAEHGMRVDHVEGGRDSRWILIDASDIIVHIFEHQERNVYGLEKLYADLPVSRYDL